MSCSLMFQKQIKSSFCRVMKEIIIKITLFCHCIIKMIIRRVLSLLIVMIIIILQ